MSAELELKISEGNDGNYHQLNDKQIGDISKGLQKFGSMISSSFSDFDPKHPPYTLSDVI